MEMIGNGANIIYPLSAGGGGSGGDVKIYQHTINIMGKDTNDDDYYVNYVIYNTNPDSLFTSPTPTYSDVMNVIRATCAGATPPSYGSNKFFSLYVNIWEESLNITITDVSTGTNIGRLVRSITSAYDTVMQM